MEWRNWFEQARDWWENSDPDTRYLAIVLVSGGLSILVLLMDKASPPRETFHRVRIENQ